MPPTGRSVDGAGGAFVLTVLPLIEPAADGPGIEWAWHPKGARPGSTTVSLI